MTSTATHATSADAALLDERIDSTEQAALAAGDDAAWERQYRAIHAPLYGYCLRLAGDEADALDLVQEAFARTMQRCRTSGAPDGLRAYLFTAARNLHLDAARRRGRGAAGSVDDVADTAVDEDAGLRDVDPDVGALVAEQRDDVRVALGGLPDRQRQALALCDMEGCSYAQVAEALELNENAVAQLVFRARGKLRLALRLRQVDESRLQEACRSNLEPISRLLDGQLRDPARGELEQHLAACADCTRLREEFSLVQKRYRAFAPALPFAFSSDDAWAQVLTRSGSRLASTGRRVTRRAALLASATLLVLLVFVGGLAALAGGGGGDDGREAVVVQASDTSEADDAPDDGGKRRPGRPRAEARDRDQDEGLPAEQDDQVGTDRESSEDSASDEASPKPRAPRPDRPSAGAGTNTDADAPTDSGEDAAVSDPVPDATTPADPQPDPTPPPPPPPPAPANLVATGASWTGAGVLVSLVNSGETTAGASTVRVRIGRRTWYGSAGSLAPGQSTSVTVSTGCMEGTFSISALVDSSGVVTESNEGDNATSASASNIC